MTTPADLISLALRDSGVLGVGQVAAAEDTQDAFKRLNWMISQWGRKRWLVYHLIDVYKTSTGALNYSVGPGGDFDTPRPDRLEAAFFRQLVPQATNQIDYPLHIISSREDYNQIALKTMGTWPSQIFYDSDYPLGYVYVWPVPAASIYQIHLTLKQPLAQFTSLSQDINLPLEYEAALFYNLAVRLRPAYQLPPDPTLSAMAKDALNVLRGANAQISTMRLPDSVVNRRWAYNVYSDGN